MPSLKYAFTTAPEQRDLLLALLSQLPFDSFQEQAEGGLDAYLSVGSGEPNLEPSLQEIQQMVGFSYVSTLIPDQNWNELWESNFEAIRVDDFCGIRADFHDPMPDVRYEILINPKMAFGTGHHSTTYMMIQQLEGLSVSGLKVFDYGCGTGILAILSAMMGATEICAVDIEQPSYENTIENAQRNGVPQVKTYLGSLEDVSETGFDLILANINRNVILASLQALYERLSAGGLLITSGFVAEDGALMEERFNEAGFSIGQRLRRNNWLCISLKK
ncbi:MAG: 50S ribosomal protein L11 methyltransferase [Bacteroidota bacterium]